MFIDPSTRSSCLSQTVMPAKKRATCFMHTPVKLNNGFSRLHCKEGCSRAPAEPSRGHLQSLLAHIPTQLKALPGRKTCLSFLNH